MPNLLQSLREQFPGKLYAFTVTWVQGPLWQLTVVVDGETGHYPVEPDDAADFSVMSGPRELMQALADRLNTEELKLPTMTVVDLITQSMRGGRR